MKYTARIDMHLQPLMPMFFENVKSEIDLMRTRLAAADYPALRDVAHGFKGAALGYGFTDLAVLGRDIEQAAIAEQSADTVEFLLEELLEYLRNVDVVFVDTDAD